MSLSPIAAFMLVSAAILDAQASCALAGPPDRYGSLGFVGQDGHIFDYWSDAGERAGTYQFQLGVKNEGKTPLTVDWLTAGFFRRGIPPNVEAVSECREDRNAPNVRVGLIKYGPLTQFDGPNARFYQAQVTTSSLTDSTTFSVAWKAFLEPDKPYSVSFKVQATVTANRQIEYVLSNFADPVEVEWPQVLTQPVLSVAQQLNQPSTVRNGRLVLARPQALRFGFQGAGIRRQSAPLSVYIPNGALLYRDVFTGPTLTEIAR